MNTILYSVSFLFSFSLCAQQQFTNNGAVNLNSGTRITFFGDFINNGSITDLGQMVSFAGTGPQNIAGNAATTFNNLTIANTGSGITLSGFTNLTVANTLTLTSGIIITSTNIVVLSSSVASSLVYTSGFIYGTFRRYIASNTSTYLYPLGDGTASTNRHQITFVNNALNAGISYLDATVLDFVQSVNNTDVNLSTTQQLSPIVHTAGEQVGHSTIWTLTPDAYTYVGGNYGVQLFVENTTLSAANDNMFCPLKRTLPSTSYAGFLTYDAVTAISPAGSAGRTFSAGTGYAQRTGYTSFSQHTIGFANGVGELPIELIDFDAKPDGNNVDLFWTTASESNSDYFRVQRSPDGTDFTDLDQQNAAGNSSIIIKYTAVDYNPYKEISYYRLKQVDNDGKFKYSNPVSVNFQNEKTISVYPNPASGTFYVCIFGMSGQKISILVRNGNGQEYYARIVTVMEDREVIEIDPLNKLAAGVYFVEAVSDNKRYEKKIVIQ